MPPRKLLCICRAVPHDTDGAMPLGDGIQWGDIVHALWLQMYTYIEMTVQPSLRVMCTLTCHVVLQLRYSGRCLELNGMTTRRGGRRAHEVFSPCVFESRLWPGKGNTRVGGTLRALRRRYCHIGQGGDNEIRTHLIRNSRCQLEATN